MGSAYYIESRGVFRHVLGWTVHTAKYRNPRRFAGTAEKPNSLATVEFWDLLRRCWHRKDNLFQVTEMPHQFESCSRTKQKQQTSALPIFLPKGPLYSGPLFQKSELRSA
jgi:hypothetical protein